jgi:hypothetical protein
VNADTRRARVGANRGASGLITLGVGRFQALSNLATTFRLTVQELYAASTFADLKPAAVSIDREFCGDLVGTFGDVNDDNAVNGADALIVLSGSVGLDVSQYVMAFGDVDGDATPIRATPSSSSRTRWGSARPSSASAWRRRPPARCRLARPLAWIPRRRPPSWVRTWRTTRSGWTIREPRSRCAT